MTSSLNLAIYASTLLDGQEEEDGGTVTLEEARASLSLFGKGLSERYLRAGSLGDAPAVLANPRRPIPFSDGREIFLPPYVNLFDTRADNWRVYRVYAGLQAGQWESGTFDRPRAGEAAVRTGPEAWMKRKEPLAFLRHFLGCFPMPFLAADIFIALETARVSSAAARRYAGLASDLAWFLARLGPNIEPVDHRAVITADGVSANVGEIPVEHRDGEEREAVCAAVDDGHVVRIEGELKDGAGAVIATATSEMRILRKRA